MNAEIEYSDEREKRFLRKHWRMLSVFGAILAAAAVLAVYVLFWFVATAQVTGFVPTTLGQWTVGYFVAFIIHLIFWELLFVGSWTLVIVGILFYRWWKSLPDEEKVSDRKRKKRDQGGGAFGFLFGITWLFVVWFDGRWALPLQAWTLNNWVYSCLAAIGWDLLIFGIPLLLYFIYWIRTEVMIDS